MDLKAFLSSPIEHKPLERKLIPTGLFIELPQGYEAQVRPRSGLALKQGLTVLNTPGTINSDYRGEVGVILINISSETQVINIYPVPNKWGDKGATTFELIRVSKGVVLEALLSAYNEVVRKKK
jgi:hypothetical protein